MCLMVLEVGSTSPFSTERGGGHGPPNQVMWGDVASTQCLFTAACFQATDLDRDFLPLAGAVRGLEVLQPLTGLGDLADARRPQLHLRVAPEVEQPRDGEPRDSCKHRTRCQLGHVPALSNANKKTLTRRKDRAPLPSHHVILPAHSNATSVEAKLNRCSHLGVLKRGRDGQTGLHLLDATQS